ncbi:PQQ-binding-like beta-propeller repeat protein [Williamsia maris]|uniref:PQQ-like domain-containing protein n=1 Tax=Williamsia maris TaxID=72806 RepID=A0ABT1HIF6_9NOCA|nr:PQQ-binding-like beta-propeller repeat protein [Williamsia maris]MCP2177690.1 PQQ-like domain-containing protein [Williamsia maris]
MVVGLVALLAIAAGATTFVLGRNHDDRSRSDRERSLGFGVRPTPLWTLDLARLTSSPGEVLLPVSTPDTSTNGSGMLLDSSGDLIAAVGPPREFNIVADVTLVGIDRSDGSPTWKRPVGPVKNCTATRIGKSIACWSPTRVIVVDTMTGRVHGEAAPDFTVSGVEVAGDATYVSGTRESGPSTALVLATGILAAPTATVRTITDAGPGESITDVVPDRKVFIARATADQNIGFASAVYSLDTGVRRFAADGIVTSISDTLFRSETYPQGIERLLDDNGSVVRSQDLSLPGGSAQPQVLGAPFVPIVMGDGVFDPITGALLWRDQVLDWGKSTGGIAPAVVGDNLIAASLDGNLIGMDARTGRRAWTTPLPGAFYVRTGITDGRYFVFGDIAGMNSVDTVTGRIVWSVDSPGDGVDGYTSVSAAGGDIVRSTKDSVSVWRARKGPDPA